MQGIVKDLSKLTYLTDRQGAEYTQMSLSTFVRWSEKIGARRRTSERRYINVREIIDKRIMEG